jgi:hypothetical protein
MDVQGGTNHGALNSINMQTCRTTLSLRLAARAFVSIEGSMISSKSINRIARSRADTHSDFTWSSNQLAHQDLFLRLSTLE